MLSGFVLELEHDTTQWQKLMGAWDSLQVENLLRGIPTEKRPSVLRCLHARLRCFDKGEALVPRAAVSSTTRYLTSGTAFIERYDLNGNRSILASCEAGDVVGSDLTPFFFLENGVSVTVIEPCTVIEFAITADVEGCQCCVKYINVIRKNIMEAMARLNSQLMMRLDVLSCRSARDKILTYLQKRALNECCNSFAIPFNRQELADYLCVERSALSRELGRMQKDGIIHFDKNHFQLASEYVVA